jgi:5-methylcytosine-specific restriction endonuclease McrA
MGLVELTPAEELQVKAIYRLRYTLTRETGIEYHVDHRIPLKHGGKHHPSNLWVITAEENLRKGSKLPA